MFHKEGKASIILVFIVAIALVTLAHYALPCWADYILYAIAAFLVVIILQFFRNPTRTIPVKDDSIVYCPADGEVVVIEEVEETEYFNDKRLQVSIFMSPLNVHVNRNSFSGVVKYYKYHAGKYLFAWNPKSSTENERTTTVLENPAGTEVMFRQIAGFLARRIVNYLKAGDTVVQGTDMGFIKLGSRVDIFLPLGTAVDVKIGDKVLGNKTILAKI